MKYLIKSHCQHPVYCATERNREGWDAEIERLAQAAAKGRIARKRLDTLKRLGRVFYAD